MNLRFSDLWKWNGRIGGGAYLLIGVIGFGIKYGIDRFIAWAFFDRTWEPYNYLYPIPHASHVLHSGLADASDTRFFITLLIVALPFIWLGVAATLNRLRSAGASPWMVMLFFIPFVNLIFFLVLCLLPEPRSAEDLAERKADGLEDERNMYENPVPTGRAILAASIVPLGLVTLGANVFRDYGWGLFVAAPFCQGFIASLVNEWSGPRSFKSSRNALLVSCLVLVTGVMAIAIEGAICIAMAAPLWIGVAWLGLLAGHDTRRWPAPNGRRWTLMLLICITPAMMGAEHVAGTLLPTREVMSSVDINAPPEEVWNQVINFSDLPDPKGWFFRTGVAYPIRAKLEGRGVGAVRHCVFSTGAFVEPINVWDEPRLLRFSVASQPPALKEWSPYKNLAPAHLDGYFKTSQGQFLLTPLPGGRTRLEGSTWYTLRIHPAFYWNLWSDRIIHRIHLRVLEHIKERAEAAVAKSSDQER